MSRLIGSFVKIIYFMVNFFEWILMVLLSNNKVSKIIWYGYCMKIDLVVWNFFENIYFFLVFFCMMGLYIGGIL